MTRLLVLAEGDSEELFVEKILSPHLQPLGVFARATCVVSKRLASGKKFTGGNLWPNVRLSLQPLLADSDAWVTTLLDFYGLPDGFPGLSGLPRQTGSALDAVLHVEGALSATMGSPACFIPFIALHEFEAWYFANPVKVSHRIPLPRHPARHAAEAAEQGVRKTLRKSSCWTRRQRPGRLKPITPGGFHHARFTFNSPSPANGRGNEYPLRLPRPGRAYAAPAASGASR